MATKIKSVAILNNQGVQIYEIGSVYNGLLLDKIVDESVQYQNSLTVVYSGYTSCGERVFKAISCPLDVLYCPV